MFVVLHGILLLLPLNWVFLNSLKIVEIEGEALLKN